jgi:hypothetical protein
MGIRLTHMVMQWTLTCQNMDDMFQEAHTPLFQGCPTNRLARILSLFNLVTMHGVSNALVDKLFSLLKIDPILKDNTLP